MSIVGSYVLYYSIVIFSTIIVTCSEKMRQKVSVLKYHKIVFWSAIIVPIIISGFRYGVGTDYFNYENIYFNLTSHDGIIANIINTRFEPGWIVLNHIVKFIFNDVKYVFILSSLLIWLLNFKAIYDNRDRINIGIAVLILLFTLYNPSFNMIRQSLAAAILMLTVSPIVEKKPIKFLFIVIAATSFHYTAVIFLPVYWLVNTKVKFLSSLKKTITVVGAGLLVVFAPRLLSLITSFEAFDYFSHYELEAESFGIGNIIIKSPIILIILLNIKKLKKTNPIYKLVIVYFLSLIIEFIGYYAQYVSRIAIYYEMMQVFILAAIVSVQTNKYKRLFYSSIVILYFIIWYTYYIIIKNNHETIPFMWW